jgi:tRNA nucleotidyltransferase/poly(A) polymerase
MAERDAQPSVPRTSKPPSNRDDALAVLSRLRDHGHTAYFAGGCVRDTLLGLKPSDFDIATDAPPDRVRQLFSNTQAVGAKFGVILVRHRKSVVEVATFRSEGAYTDGRRPDTVRFTTPEEDARRRDFTINGMFFDPIAGQVVDFVGGQADLASRILRAIGNPDERFAEDHLRLLRAVRFAARFGFHIEPSTAEASTKHAPHLKAISPERIAEELRLMITPTTRNAAWRMLWAHRLVPEIMRFLPSQAAPHALDQQRSIFLALPGDRISFGLALAAGTLCYRVQASPESDIDVFLDRAAVLKAVGAMRQALRFSNEESDEMQQTLLDAGLLLLAGDADPTVATMKRFLARPTAAGTRALLTAVRDVGMRVAQIDHLEERLSCLQREDCAPPPMITGDDLMVMNLPPGPIYKKILDRVYDAQLEHRVRSRDEALDMARQLSVSIPSTG